MANSESAKKRIRQIEKRTARNKNIKSRVKTLQGKAIELAEAGKHEEAMAVYRDFTSAVDKATKNNVFAKNKAANLKSRTNKALKPS